MAHELTVRRGGKVEMAYTGATPWHGLGEVLRPGASLETWLAAAGMDWQIHASKVLYQPFGTMDGDLMEFDDRLVLSRSDDGAGLGIVSDQYKPVQPREVLEFFRDLTEDYGMTLETAGTLFGGKRFWALARVTDDVPLLDPRDKIGGYLLLSTSADGSLATEARWTTIRVVCNNTLSLAVNKRGKAGPSGAQVRVTHKTEFDPEQAKRQLGINIAAGTEAIEDAMGMFRRLAATPLSADEMVGLTLRAFGHKPEELSRKELEAAAKTRAVMKVGDLAITGTGLMGAAFQGGHGTGWGWLNAVSQYVDHDARARSQSNRLDSAWFGRGDGVKSKALELVLEATGGGATRTMTRWEDDAPGGSVLDDILAATPPAA